jgi:IS5 family transposase
VSRRDDTQAIQAESVRSGTRRPLSTAAPLGRVMYDLWLIKARIRAKAEHLFRVVKCQFGHVKAHCVGLKGLLRLWRIKIYCQ